jgi:hypothetical protein
MPCNISHGRVEECKEGISGLHAVYFINYTSASFTLDADDVVTAFPTPALTAYKYELKGANGFNTTVNTSRDNGTTFFAQEISIQLKKLDPIMSKELKLLAYGRPQIIAHTRTGDAFLIGKDGGADMTAGSINSGIQYGDFNGYQMTFVANEKLPPLFLDGSTIDDPFAGVANPPTIISA